MSGRAGLLQALRAGHPDIAMRDAGDRLVVETAAGALAELAFELTTAHGCEFATLVVEQAADGFAAHYFFYHAGDGTLVEIAVTAAEAELLAISDRVHAADWHEREAEDMFGIHFSGHPFLGDFVLHDTEWPEGVEPMRHGFDPRRRVSKAGLGADWRPRQLLEEPGAFVFPVGPVWSDYAESGLWLLETPGEQIRQAH
jgi:Ni,Fe-hydrogenase III component G